MILLNNGLSGPPWGVPSSLASNKPLFITPLRRYLCIRLTTLPSFYRTAEDFYKFAMAHGVEEAFKVKVYYIYVAFVDYPLRSS